MVKCRDCGCLIEDHAPGGMFCPDCHLKRFGAPVFGTHLVCTRCGKPYTYGMGTYYDHGTAYCSSDCRFQAEQDLQKERLEEQRRQEEQEEQRRREEQSSAAEQYGGNDRQGSEIRSYTPPVGSSSSSSSPEGGPVQVVLGLLVLIAIGWGICWGGYRGYRWLFYGEDKVDVTAERMASWQRHLEQRCKAFGDGMSETEVEAKGLKNYTWDEWQAREKAAEKPKDASGPGIAIVSKKVKEIGDTAKAMWQNLSSKDEEDTETKLKKLNARLAELEGEGKVGEQQQADAQKVEAPKPTGTDNGEP